jgi:tetratricopeptide (TPR) repeat protein
MKKLLFTILVAAGSFSVLTYTSCKSSEAAEQETKINDEVSVPALLKRDKTMGNEAEQKSISEAYDKAIESLKLNPDDLKQYIKLAGVYIAEGRITGNNSYYGSAAMQMANKVVDEQTANKDLTFQALSIKSAVLLNLHQFKEALAVAKQAEAMNQTNAAIYGALVDANVELGNYDQAVKDCDRMMAIRPDLRSYSRVSYLRQIYGDNRGAIDAMRMAVEAGGAGDENTEWARVTLGDLYMAIGNLDSAEFQYKYSLGYRDNYPYAQIGMAKVEKARKNYDSAITLTKAAINTMSESAFVSQLADLYELKGDNKKAEEIRKDVIDLLKEGEQENETAKVKHNGNRELANAFLAAKKYDEALAYAKKDLEMRPDNVDANELASWICYQKGDYATAKTYADKSLRMNTKDPATLYKAGLIYVQAGDAAKGNALLQEAQTMAPFVDKKLVLAVK